MKQKLLDVIVKYQKKDIYLQKIHTVAISITNMAVADAYPDNENKEVIIKKYAPFTDYISEINNAQVDNGKYIDVVMPM